MKLVSQTIMLVALATTFATTSFAQGKIGYINVNEVMSVMPERTDAENGLKTFASTLQMQFSLMSKEYESKLSDYQSLPVGAPDSMKATKVQELQDLQLKISEFQSGADAKLQEKEAELLKPIVDKVQAAIDQVAKANGYDHVFDTSTGMVLVFPEANNITTFVKKELGL
jgi:outer membrane protein